MTPEQRAARQFALEYSNDGRVELCRRIVALEELVADLMPIVCGGCHERVCDEPDVHPFVTCTFANRMRELGMEP